MAQALDRSTELERALKLAELVESSSDAVVGLSPAGLIVSWSGGAEGLFGYSRAEAVGRHVMMLLHPIARRRPGASPRNAWPRRIVDVPGDRANRQGRSLLKVLLSISPVWGGGERAGSWRRSSAISASSGARRTRCAKARSAIARSWKLSMTVW